MKPGVADDLIKRNRSIGPLWKFPHGCVNHTYAAMRLDWRDHADHELVVPDNALVIVRNPRFYL